jgi:uncharacterized DUF497 family protein
MLPLTFEWDPGKDRRNQRKHDVSFSEASSIFFDEQGILIHDPDHSNVEDRYLLLGMSAKLRVLVVSHTYRDDDRVIRIIAAWTATPQERDQYGRIG